MTKDWKAIQNFPKGHMAVYSRPLKTGMALWGA